MRIKLSPLDILFSNFIRLRAMKRVGGCERCLTPKVEYTQLQCSHYHKRRKYSVRWDEDNCNGFCFGCHQYFEENRDEYTIWMTNLLGEERMNMLAGRMRHTHPKPDEELIGLYLKELIKVLEGT